jgi:hypothetical protein
MRLSSPALWPVSALVHHFLSHSNGSSFLGLFIADLAVLGHLEANDAVVAANISGDGNSQRYGC